MAPPPPAPDADPSMEEILASIRRILNEDPVSDAATPASPDAATPASLDDGVLVLDKSMMRDPPVKAEMVHPATELPESGGLKAEPSPDPVATQADTAGEPLVESPAPQGTAPQAAELVAPEAAAAAAMAMGNLMRTLAADRQPKVWSEGPTLEDLVRVTLRPLLKEWLDANLPPIVERLVRTEIERVVGRVIP
jgi:cell pole-organizing protein PopZ